MEIMLSYVLKGVGIAVGGIIIAVGKKALDYFGLRITDEQRLIFEDKIEKEIYAVEEKIAGMIKNGVEGDVLEQQKEILHKQVVQTAKNLDKTLSNIDAEKVVKDAVSWLPDVGAFKF